MFITRHQKLLYLVSLIIFCYAPVVSSQKSVESAAPHQVNSEPEIILFNANILTMDETQPTAQAVAIDGNLILAVGSNAEILALQTAGTQLLDLQGRTIVPGLIEAHSHYLLEGFRNGGLDGLARASQEIAADGYTTVHELFGDTEGLIPALQTLSEAGRLAVRVNVYLQYNSNCGDDRVPWMNYPYTVKKDTTLRVIGVKIFADGGSCLCPALSQPRQSFLEECGPFGHLFKTQEEMNATVAEVLNAGYPIAMHAIGDSAIGVGLNAFENAFAGNGNQLRSRMEHLRVMREDLADQMAALGIAASIQYTWAIVERAPVWEASYLPPVLDWVYPWRRMADRGIPIVGGNDFPFVFHFTQGLQTISLLATRKFSREEALPAWMEGDELTVQEGLRAMTVTNAWVAFEENVKGAMTVGKLADLTVLSDDPLAMDAYDVRDIAIEMTLMDGIVRYDRITAGSNIAVNKPVSASNALASNPPALAVDGNTATHWGAGNFPPQWIEIDLEAPTLIKGIRLTTDQFPDGETTHQVWGKGPEATSDFELLHEFSGFTATEQVLEVTPIIPWTEIQFIKVETVQSPSWVAWREIEVITNLPTSVSSHQPESLPETITLSHNYPNPFNPATKIQYKLQQTGHVKISILNMKGQLITTLVDERQAEGDYSVAWNGTDALGKTVASGVYFFQLKTKEFTKVIKMLLMR